MKIEMIRKKINNIDDKIIKLLNERLENALKIGEIKNKLKIELFKPAREEKVINKILRINKIFPEKDLVDIYKIIMSACRALEGKMKIAFLGPEATFTHCAALKKFGNHCEYISAKTISDVLEKVENKKVNYGLVPVENSYAGVVDHTLDSLLEYEKVFIISEIYLDIKLCLLSKMNKKAGLKKLYSHPHAIAQSMEWINKNLSGIKIIETESTGIAAKKAARDKFSAAIASEAAAKVYNLPILEKNIDYKYKNITRFLVIGQSLQEKSRADKTSIAISVKDKVGALYEIIKPFGKYKINMTKIESRPSKKKAWDYIFFIDVAGHKNDKKLQKCLKEIKNKCVFFRILGSYPKERQV